jgi:hypothetical protein
LTVESNLTAKCLSIQGADHSVLCGQMRSTPQQEHAGEECQPLT